MEIRHSNSNEIRFSQENSIINYGDATVTTYNLVNCIAIGGRFRSEDGSRGIFFTHESPTDKDIQKDKLRKMKDILKDTVITDIFIFRIDPSQASKSVYNNGTTIEGIISEMIGFTRDLFSLEPTILNYLCDFSSFGCGKASISLDNVRTNIERMTEPPQEGLNNEGLNNEGLNNEGLNNEGLNNEGFVLPFQTSHSNGTFEPIYLKNRSGNLVIQCPICELISGTILKSLSHKLTCPNKNKKPDLTHMPTEGGYKNKNNKNTKRRVKRKSGKKYKRTRRLRN